MAWSFILTDKDYVPLGEIINASDRRVALPLSKLDTASFRVRLDNPLANSMMDCSGHIKAYRDGQLRFYGPILSAEESGDANGATVAVNAVGAGWILSKRLGGKSTTGTQFTTVTDRAVIMKSLIDTTNTENETGISTSAYSMTAASAVTYTAGPYKPLSDINTELATSLDGYDWRILPLENYASGAVTGSKIGGFSAAPVLGIDQTNAVFEWGAGRNNIVEYTRAVTRDTMANQVYHVIEASSNAVISALDTTSISNYKLLEDLAQADLTDSSMRQNLVNEHVRVRKVPRQVISFTPHVDPQRTGRVPYFGDDFDVADSVRARIVYNGVARVDAMLRVWGVTFDIDSLGTERMTLTLAEE